MQTQELITDFTGQKGVPKAIYDIAYRYHNARRDDKALELHQYNVEHFPSNSHAIDSQAEIIYYYIVHSNDTATETAFGKLLTVFAQHEALPKKIYQVAMMYSTVNRPEIALSLHKYNLGHFPQSGYTMYSQIEIVYSHLRNGDDAATDAAFDKLITGYSDQPTLPKEVYLIANTYRKAEKYEKVKQFYHYVIDNPCEADQQIWKKASMIKLNSATGNEAEARSVLNSLIADFSNHPEFMGIIISLADEPYSEIQTALNRLIANVKDYPDLPMAILVAGEQYYKEGLSKEEAGLTEQAKDCFQKAVKLWGSFINNLPDSASIPPNIMPELCCWAGDGYLKLGRYEESIQCFQKVADDYPIYEHAEHAQFLVGHCYEEWKKAGTLEESVADAHIKAAFERVIQEYPDYEAADYARQWLSQKLEAEKEK